MQIGMLMEGGGEWPGRSTKERTCHLLYLQASSHGVWAAAKRAAGRSSFKASSEGNVQRWQFSPDCVLQGTVERFQV